MIEKNLGAQAPQANKVDFVKKYILRQKRKFFQPKKWQKQDE
jgi:hypothetical protein